MGLSDRKFFVEFAEQLRCRIQLFAAGGGNISNDCIINDYISCDCVSDGLLVRNLVVKVSSAPQLLLT
jgi:hypothetical protein